MSHGLTTALGNNQNTHCVYNADLIVNLLLFTCPERKAKPVIFFSKIHLLFQYTKTFPGLFPICFKTK